MSEEKEEKESDPAIPKTAPKGDQITNVIGEVGRWQLEKILIVFIAAAPGELRASTTHCLMFDTACRFSAYFPCWFHHSKTEILVQRGS